MRLTIVPTIDEHLQSISPVVAMERFPENRHTGPAIARWMTSVVGARMLMTMASISVFTLDGASSNKKAVRLLKKPMEVCAPHNLQRAVLTGLGVGMKASTNPPIQGNDITSFHHLC